MIQRLNILFSKSMDITNVLMDKDKCVIMKGKLVDRSMMIYKDILGYEDTVTT